MSTNKPIKLKGNSSVNNDQLINEEKKKLETQNTQQQEQKDPIKQSAVTLKHDQQANKQQTQLQYQLDPSNMASKLDELDDDEDEDEDENEDENEFTQLDNNRQENQYDQSNDYNQNDQSNDYNQNDQFDDQFDDLEGQLPEFSNDDFLPLPPDYIIRQQQIATYQMLSQFLMYQDKNITDVLNDVRVSVDCLTKSVLQLNKNLDKHFSNAPPATNRKRS